MPQDPQPRHARIGDIWIDVSIREQHAYEAEVSEHPVEVGSAIADHVRPLPRSIEIEGLVTNHPIEPPQSHAGGARRVNEQLQLYTASRNPPRVAPFTQTIEGEPGLGGFESVIGTGQPTALLGVLHLDIRTRRRFAAEVRHYQADAKSLAYGAEVLRFNEPFDRVREVHAALLRIVDDSLLVTVTTALATYNSVALTRVSIERSGQIGRDALRFTATGRVLRLVSTESADVPSRVVQSKSRGKQPTTPVDASTLAPLPPDIPRDSFGYGEGGIAGVYSALFGGGAQK